nr:MAG TPA: hypothetical protein [Crassvirales sp.]
MTCSSPFCDISYTTHRPRYRSTTLIIIRNRKSS